MAAGIFGALGAIGDAANQVAEGRQLAHDEIVRRLAESQQRQASTLNMERTRQLIQQTAQNMRQAQQPIAVGNPYVSGGKTYQRYQDPQTGKVTASELPGPTAETPEQTLFRGLMAIPGMTEETASAAVVKKFSGKTSLKRDIAPDPSSPTGFSAVYRDEDGNVMWAAPTLPPRTAVPRETDRTSVDQFGNKITSHSVTRPVFGPAAIPVGGPVRSLGAFGGTTTPPKAAASRGVAATPQDDANSRALASPAAPVKQTTVAAGPYKGLTPQGEIPAKAPVNPQVREYANDILAGRDVTKIPMKARALAESVARRYGWKGQGSLTPAQQMQIEQVDRSLANLDSPKYTRLFDSAPLRFWMSMLPMDPTGEGGFAGLKAAVQRGTIPQDAAEYMDDLTRLRGVITGIRSFTGANNSNATADRLLAELPNFTNVKNSADAKYKLSKLRQEVSIIKRLGYFLDDAQSPVARASSPAKDANPMGLDLPTAGR